MRLIGLMILAVLAAPLSAQDAPDAVTRWRDVPTEALPAEAVDPGAFDWIARQVIVFAPSPAHPLFAEQMEMLAARPEPLVERDVVVITDTDPRAPSALRAKMRPRGFMLVLTDKDGTVELRKPVPWDVRELSRAIDKMPLRQQEIRHGRSAGR